MELTDLMYTAENLIDGDFDNTEYVKAICEMIANLYPERGVETPTRAKNIGNKLGATTEQVSKFY